MRSLPQPPQEGDEKLQEHMSHNQLFEGEGKSIGGQEGVGNFLDTRRQPRRQPRQAYLNAGCKKHLDSIGNCLGMGRRNQLSFLFQPFGSEAVQSFLAEQGTSAEAKRIALFSPHVDFETNLALALAPVMASATACPW